MAETRTITGIPGIRPSVIDRDDAGRQRGGYEPHERSKRTASRVGPGDISLENLSKLLATLSMQGARRQGITDITAQESGSGFSPIQRHVRDFGPEPTTDWRRKKRAMEIAKETPMDTLYQKAGAGRGTQGFGLGRRGPSESSQREGEQDHARALARKMLEGRSVNRGDPADVLRRYGGGLRRDDPAPVNYRSQAPTFDRFNR
jgi:hypothetical protein